MKYPLTGCAAALLLLSMAGPQAARAQSWTWANAASGVNTAESWAEKVAFDAAGNAVVLGHFTGKLVLGSHTLQSAGGEDVFVARLDATGSWTQAVRAGGPGNDYGLGLALAPDGTATVVGGFESALAAFGPFLLPNADPAAKTQDVFVARLSPAGVWTQAARAGSPGSDRATAVGLAPDGTATVAGSFGGATATFAATVLHNVNPVAGLEDTFVARFSPAGLWTMALAAGSTDVDRPNDVAVASDGSAVVVGTFYGEKMGFDTKTLHNAAGRTGTADAFVARVAATGGWVQAVSLGGSASDEAFGVALHANGDAAVVGSFASPSLALGPHTLTNSTPGNNTYTDLFVGRLSVAGLWTQAASAGGNHYDWLNSVTVDAQGRTLVAGSFTSTLLTAGTLTLATSSSATTHNDVLVATLDANGQWSSLVGAGGPQLELATSVAYSPTGRVVVAGVLKGAGSRFGATTLVGAKPTAFVAGLGQLPLASPAAAAMPRLAVVPNPAHGTVRVSLPVPAPAALLQVLDVSGREVRRLPAGPGSLALDVAGLAPGLYVLRCGTAAGRLVVE